MQLIRETKAEVYLPLTQGKIAVIDFEDFEKVRPYKWCLLKIDSEPPTFYAKRGVRKNGKHTVILLHRELTGCPDNLQVDHRDGDGLNNRQENLRICTRAQNQNAFRRKAKNTSSRFRGVCWNKQKSRWKVRVQINGKNIELGHFKIEGDAALAYDAAAIKYFGEYAVLNFPPIVY